MSADFRAFAASYGLEIDHLVYGKWTRVRTTDKPRKKNGAYIFDGHKGAVKNWGTMEKAETWREHVEPKALTEQERRDREQRIAISRQRTAEEIRRKHAKAAAEAEEMSAAATLADHDYFKHKGFPNQVGMVLPDGRLFIPMYVSGRIAGGQTIEKTDAGWTKKYIFGTEAKGAYFRIGRGRETWLVEGYATGLSVHAAIQRMRIDADVLVCFSAGNLLELSKVGHYVFADNDESRTGENAAIKTGLPYCMAPEVGCDANDWHQMHGLSAVVALMMEARKR